MSITPLTIIDDKSASFQYKIKKMAQLDQVDIDTLTNIMV